MPANFKKINSKVSLRKFFFSFFWFTKVLRSKLLKFFSKYSLNKFIFFPFRAIIPLKL